MTAAKIAILPLKRASPPVPHQQQSTDDSNNQSPPKADAIGKVKPAKRSRSSKSKVRTGCLTCKIRRVKCDETKPACNRCTSTGRKCDGYDVPPKKKEAQQEALPEALGAPERCLAVVPGTSHELRVLEFFHVRTAPGLSSYFDANFWTRLVFQMSNAEPAIRHAMVAVGSLHQQRELGTKPVTVQRSAVIHDPLAVSVPITKHASDHNDPFALTQYNKAILHLSKRLQDPVTTTEIALLACVLFVCVEFLRGEIEPAMKHFKSGMGIAIQTLSHDGSRKALATMQRIKENMLPFFNRLELLSMLFGNDASWEYPVTLHQAVPEEFASIVEARDSIVHLMNLSLRFIRSMKYRKYDHLVLPDDVARQQSLQRQSRQWGTTLDNFFLHNPPASRNHEAAKVLRIHQLVMGVWLSASTLAEESSNDAHMADFEKAVSLGEAIQAHAGTRDQKQTYTTTFLFDMETVSPLYYIAIKCRHPVVRRRAIRLLRRNVRREGLWDSNVAAAIAERIMAIEERKLTMRDGGELPEEYDRIHNSHIQSMAGMDPREHAVTFYSKPNGPDGPWKIWQEGITLDPPSNPRAREGDQSAITQRCR